MSSVAVVFPVGGIPFPDSFFGAAAIQAERNLGSGAGFFGGAGAGSRRYPLIYAGTAGPYSFGREYWESPAAFNALMLSRGFYKSFAVSYDWILVHHLDAVTLSDELEDFVALADHHGWDYVGAPLPSPPYRHGCNGGLSLRRLSAFIDLAPMEWVDPKWLARTGGPEVWNEDLWWSFHSGVRVADPLTAARFAWETSPELHAATLGPGQRPFGLHGYQKHSPDFYQSLLEEMGIA